MGSFIVGTAGHIDHGKSALVRALTGTDPDRLKEEQERGITIDLGFAHLDLEGVAVSFIDVPGHERFVRNMLAGAHGIDAVVLVVAADESVMPQTREHFHICRLLGVGRGLVALTKCDVADPELQATAELEVRELLEGTFLEDAELVRVSARTGQGLDALRAALLRLAPEREGGRASPEVGPSGGRASPGVGPSGGRDAGPLRLPVDRVFTLRGFGTVVTGTLVQGELALGDELEVLPVGKRARVRGLQIHGQACERVGAGHRTAVNLAGLEVADLSRGDVLAHPGTLRPTSVLDCRLELLAGEKGLRDQARVRIHVASAERIGRVRLLESRLLEPGASGLAQLRLERPTVAGLGDRLVIRSYSPAVTIGGARVLDPLPPRRRRGEQDRLALLAAIDADDAAGSAARMVEAEATRGLDAATLAARVMRPREELLTALRERGLVELAGDPAWLLAPSALKQLADAAAEALSAFHGRQPLKPGMPREELRRRVFARAPAGAFERVVEAQLASGALRVVGDGLALGRHAVTLSPQESDARQALEDAVRGAGLTGLTFAEAAESLRRPATLLERVARVLQDQGQLRRVGEARLVHREHLQPLTEQVRKRWPPGTKLDVGGFKELTGLSRKYVIPLLEHLDREKITRRIGAERWVL